MTINFNVKYGKNKIEILLPNGEVVKTEFIAKYGRNKIIFPTNPRVVVEFDLKYGENSIEIEIPTNTLPISSKTSIELFTNKVTIYNDISADAVNPRRFNRFVIDKCLIYNQMTESADGTIQRVVNTQNVITKDTEHYKTPFEYARLPVDVKEQYYTVQPNDVVIYGEVDDVVTTRRELDDLINGKYENNGFIVTTVNAYLKGTNTNNIHIMHA